MNCEAAAEVHEENRTVVFKLWFADQATLNFILSQRIPVG